MVRFFTILFLFFLLVPVTYIHGTRPPANTGQAINLEPVVLDSENPDRKRIGQLEFLAGWRMDSENDSFGGISGMLALPDSRFLMLTDRGAIVGFTLDETENKTLRPFIADLPEGPPRPNVHARRNWDSESLLHDAESGRFWIGFEQKHGIWRYGPGFASMEIHHQPPAMQDWPNNGGAEAMLRLPDERFVVFSESATFKPGGTQVLIFPGDAAEPGTKPMLLGHAPPSGYRITDAVLLDEERALLLHRRFTPLEGVSAILSIAKIGDIAEGKIWESDILARFKPPVTVDNMEALAVTGDAENPIIWIASDDNFNPVQQTILMKFRLLRGKADRASKKPSAEKEKAGTKPGSSESE